MSDEENKIPNNKTYIVDQKDKMIIAYPIERKILYAISKLGKKEKIIKDEYFLINETLSELINVGNSINMVEPLRDFNGYSWTTIPQEIESIDHNLIYQDLRILVGHEFLNKWIKNNEFIIDYYYLFKEKIENQYGKKNEKKLIDLLSKISILLGMKFNKEKYNDILEKKEEIETELEKMQDKEKFIEEITQNKQEIKKRIKQIDETINNKNMLQEEYIKRNEQLPLEKKIFSMRILSKIMAEEKEKNLKKYEYLNELMNPQNFVKYKNERWWCAWTNWNRSIFMNMNTRMTMRIRTSMTTRTTTSTRTTMKTRNMFRTGWQEPPDICSTSARWWTKARIARTF